MTCHALYRKISDGGIKGACESYLDFSPLFSILSIYYIKFICIKNYIHIILGTIIGTEITCNKVLL